jgi:isopenicillin N synthase-like dioxygenase
MAKPTMASKAIRLHQVDFAAVTSGQQLEKLDLACQQWGFFELVNHPISEVLCGEMLTAMAHFFSLPEEQKQACKRTEHNHWGYYDRERTKNVQDWKQLFDVGPERGQCIPQWPAGEGQFKRTAETFSQSCEEIALGLVGSIARSLRSDPASLLGSFTNHSSYLRMNHYPESTGDTWVSVTTRTQVPLLFCCKTVSLGFRWNVTANGMTLQQSEEVYW